MSFIQNLFSSRDNNANSATYVGQQDRIWWDPVTNAFYYSDGNTAGGIPIGSSSGNGMPHGPTNSVQLNAGNGWFLGSGSLVFSSNVLSVTGNVSANYFIGDGGLLSNISGANIVNGYGNANVAAYLPTYTGNLSGGNISVTGNVNLGNLYIIDETIYGKNINQDIVLSPEGSGNVSVPGLKIPVGSVIQGTTGVVPVITTGTLSAVLTYSAGNTLPAGSYGIPINVPPPWTVYQLTTTPTPALILGDIISGAGVPAPSAVVTPGTGANANVFVTNQTYTGYPTPVPTPGTIITVARPITHNALNLATLANTDVSLNPGAGGQIVLSSNIIPSQTNSYSLGTPGARFNNLWLGAGTLNLLDQYLNINQSVYAYDGNLIIGGGTGLKFGQFEMYDSTISTINGNANIVIGKLTSNAYVEINRPLSVNSTGGLGTAFEVDRSGRTTINVPGNIAPTQAALNIVGSSSGNSQPRNFSGTLIQVTGQDNTPARISFDAFGANGAQNSYVAIAGRAARGTVDAPTALQANDLMTRITSQGWTGNGVYAASIARLNFAAAETFTSNVSTGTYANIQLTPIGSNVIQTVVGFAANGVVFGNTAQTGAANLGIRFQDGTFQNTAYSPTTTVTSATAATGITVTPATTGNITITNTGVITVAGTANQVFVNGANNVAAANGIISLSLPQDIATSSSPTFNTLTVNNLVILGNVSNVIPSTVSGPIVYVANTATQLSDINNSGLVTGNAANGYYAGMLYQTTGPYANTWDLTIGNSIGVYAGNLYADIANVQGQLHVGNATTHLDYPYAVIQGDIDVNSYTQIVLQNHNQGANASADYVAVNNIGDDGNNYIDMGINSNVYNNNDYFVTKANDGYLYVNGGNLVIGTQSPAKTINFFTGGTNNSANFLRASVSDTGLSVAGNVTANNFTGNTVTTVSVNASANIITNNLLANSQVSAAGAVTGQNIYTAGIVSATGNIIGGNIRAGSGSISTTGNVVAGNLVTATTTIDGGVSTTGNVTANAYLGSLVSVTGNVTGSYVIATTQVNAPAVSVSGNIVAGNINSVNVVSASGNIIAGNVNIPAGRISVAGNVDSGNLRTSGLVSATGNIGTAGYFVGDGGFISNITVAAGTKIVNGTSYANIAASGGNLVIVVGGNTIETVTSTGSNITGYANVSGNVTAGNVTTAGLISATGNVIGGNVTTAGLISATGNATVGNLLTAGIQSSTGNAIAGNIVTGGVITATGNITSGNILSSGLISTTGNATHGNILTGGVVSATGNITGANISATGNISDANGLLRSLPINSQGSAYQLTATDNGNLISISSGNVTVPASVFASPFGQAVTVYNNSGTTRYITQAANVTLRLGGTAATGNRTLAQYGLATIVCVSANTFVVSGVGLS
jgi:hypothetical protein